MGVRNPMCSDTPLKKSRGFFLQPQSLPSVLAVQTGEVPCPEAFCKLSLSPLTCSRVPLGTANAHRAIGNLSVRKEERLCQTQQRFYASLPLNLIVCYGTILTDVSKTGKRNRAKVPRCPSPKSGRTTVPPLGVHPLDESQGLSSPRSVICIIIQEDIIQETLPMGYSIESQAFK